MKAQADKKRYERFFQVGDNVYMKLQPYVQSSLAYRSNQKLAFKYYGPFEVLQKIGAVAYKLNLLANSKVHSVVHVSQLKQQLDLSIQPSLDLSSVCTDPSQALVPEAILNTRMIQKGSMVVKQLLVRWLGLPEDTAI